MVDTSPVNAETIKPSACTNPCNVHGTLFDRIFPRTETMHSVHFSVFGDCFLSVLQWFQ